VTGTLDIGREAGEGDLAKAPDSEAQRVAARSPLELFWRRLKSDRVAMTALIFIVFLILSAILAPLIVKLTGQRPPNEQSTKYLDSFGTPSGPSSENWFGVDPLGRSVFSRVLYGARVSLEVALGATAVSVTIGVTVGMIAGFFRGWVDTLLSRLIDILLAFPILLLAIGLASACSLGNGCLGGLLQPGKWLVLLVIAFVNWTYIARIIRGQVLSMREKEFVDASRSLGASNRRIIFKELLPNLVAPIVVSISLTFPANVTAEAGLSFLGLGITGSPSIGQTIARAQNYYQSYPLYLYAPVFVLMVMVLALNLLGDSVRDAFDPGTRR
jgi:peptide/nickel transport system permease protein